MEVAVHSAELPKPITTDDGTFTTTVSEIDWSGSDPRGPVRPIQRAGPGNPDGNQHAHLPGRPALQRRHIGRLDPGPHQGGTGSRASRPHPGPDRTRKTRWGTPGPERHLCARRRTGAARARESTTAWPSPPSSWLPWAMGVAVLAVWLGRPTPRERIRHRRPIRRLRPRSVPAHVAGHRRPSTTNQKDTHASGSLHGGPARLAIVDDIEVSAPGRRARVGEHRPTVAVPLDLTIIDPDRATRMVATRRRRPVWWSRWGPG